jgi:hypothetical protein
MTLIRRPPDSQVNRGPRLAVGACLARKFETLGVGGRKVPIACVVAPGLGASGNELLGGLNCRLPHPSHTGPRAGFSHQGAQPSGGCAGRCPGRAGHPIARRQKGRRNRYYVSGTLNTQAGTDRAQGWRLPPEEIEDAVIRVLADALICRSGGTGAVSKSVVVLTRSRGFEPSSSANFSSNYCL